MKKLLSVLVLSLSTVIVADQTQSVDTANTEVYGECPDFGGAQNNDVELISTGFCPIAPLNHALAYTAMYVIVQTYSK